MAFFVHFFAIKKMDTQERELAKKLSEDMFFLRGVPFGLIQNEPKNQGWGMLNPVAIRPEFANGLSRWLLASELLTGIPNSFWPPALRSEGTF
ncbi:MAG: hypothetical protein U5K69_21640 [Balneolaceae bacterium]|nr:hypothetical protein [Balneolaceae bacterium]